MALAFAVSGAPQGRVLSVLTLEAEGDVTSVQLAVVRDALVTELKAQGYATKTGDAGPAAHGVVGGALLKVGATWAISVRLTDVATNRILATTTVRCGAAEKLGEAAREAAAQLAREGREQWGVRATFKPKKNPPGQP